MTKKEMFEQAKEILAKYNVSGKASEAILELLEPKKGGQTVDIESIVKRDDLGNIVEIKCSLSGVWLPATEEFFYGDKNSKLNGLTKHSRQAYKIKSDAAKVYKASKEAIMNDVLDGNLTPEDGKAQLEALSTEPDYSSVTATLPEPEAE